MIRLISITLAFVLTCCVTHAQDYLTGYAAHWTNPSGQPAEFFINGITTDSAYELNIYDVNSEVVGTIVTPIRPQSVADGITKPWEEGVDFESQTLELPELPNGVYRIDGPERTAHAIPFLVGDQTSSESEIVVIYPTNTINAYTRTGGVNLYQRLSDGRRPPAVSFLRPQEGTATPRKMHLTVGLDRLLMTMDASVNYIADYDLESYDAIAGAKLLIVPGHSEYWTETARRHFDQFVDRGGSALILSGNTMYRSVGYDDPENPTQLTFPKRQAFTQELLGYQTYESIGADFYHGGNGSGWPAMRSRIVMPYDGWKVLDASPSYLATAGVQAGDVIHDPAAEYDGVPYLECDPDTGPTVDTERLGFHRLDLIAFENTTSNGEFPACASWIDFNKTRDSGRIINVASVMAASFFGDNAELQRAITENMIELLLIEQADFDRDERLTSADIDILSFAAQASPSPLRFDLTEDSMVNSDDIDRWITDFADTVHGDINVDGVVEFADFLIFNDNFGASNALWSQGDFTADGQVDFDDFLFLSTNYGFGQAARTHPVPEPTLAWQLIIALGCCIHWVRSLEYRL